ncbi:hypothetical protein LSTR_LSTR011426 [Laodelphax striatellus]|uniref:Uncharacterized protein n=1 Tax=Laodelphax striatellus TaxID=195883 RepID=A0A482WNX4_LAOST|nr:hypothetical protein LSTR_LSTR011426 [Laodelphax striatellus]
MFKMQIYRYISLLMIVITLTSASLPTLNVGNEEYIATRIYACITNTEVNPNTIFTSIPTISAQQVQSKKDEGFSDNALLNALSPPVTIYTLRDKILETQGFMTAGLEICEPTRYGWRKSDLKLIAVESVANQLAELLYLDDDTSYATTQALADIINRSVRIRS